MEKILRPERLNLEVKSTDAEIEYKHWIRTFDNFLGAVIKEDSDTSDTDKLKILLNYITPKVHNHIADCTTYTGAKAALQSVFVKKKNVICARYLLLNKKQDPSETISDYVATLKQLTSDCDFQQVSAQKYRDEMLLNAFVGGVKSDIIRQRLLEESDLDFDKAVIAAKAKESAKDNSDYYRKNIEPHFSANASLDHASTAAAKYNSIPPHLSQENSKADERKCYFCREGMHKKRK